MDMLIPIVTAQGLARIVSAEAQGISARITHIAIGDRGYEVPVNAAGQATSTELLRERERIEIQSVQDFGSAVELAFIADSNLNYTVRELGFYLEDGTLFAIWSDNTTALGLKSSAIPFIFAFTVDLRALPDGTVIIQQSGPPLELLNANALATTLTILAQQALIMMEQHDAFRKLEKEIAYGDA